MTDQLLVAGLISQRAASKQTNFDIRPDLERLGETKLGNDVLIAWQSTAELDDAWDAFVETLPQGRHEQTSRWANVRALSGWHPLRLLVTRNGTLVGGCQIKWKQARYVGRIGYVIYAPLLATDKSDLATFTVEHFIRLVSRNGLRALLIQPAQDSKEILSCLNKAKLLPNNNHLHVMTQATTAIALSPDEEAILENMRPSRRRNIRRNTRRAESAGLRFIEGGEADLQVAFDRICQTCARQGVTPNPPSVEILQRMWQLYNPSGYMKLFFLAKGEEKVCVFLMLGFGERALIWRGGWDGSYSDYTPNDMMVWGAIKWAKSVGYKHFDFDGIDRNEAELILSHKKIPTELAKSPAYFKLSFGGDLIPFPGAQVYFPNPLLRWGFRAFSWAKNTKQALLKRSRSARSDAARNQSAAASR